MAYKHAFFQLKICSFYPAELSWCNVHNSLTPL